MPDSDKLSAEIKITVPFHDVDSAQVVWHGRYIKYFEIARNKLLDNFNYSHRAMEESGYLWPIIDLRVKYIRPLVLDQEILVNARITEWEFRLKIEYQIRDVVTLEKLTKAYTIQVAYDIKKNEMLYASPPILKNALGVD
ncbi:MAG: acyl-CoA thioesterase [Gammaproteobacteria bacterium]|nr:acyl-CoA thioesterase [Gammaproteobacteria bacterium]